MVPKLRNAVLASFLVYLLPIVGAHIAMPWGVALGAELTEGLNRRGPLWVAADVALSVVLQVLAGSVAYWFFAQPNWRRFLAVTAAVPTLWMGMMMGYLVLVPKYFLVDAVPSPDVATWEEACRVSNAELVDVNTPIDLSLERTRTAFVALTPDSDLALLRMPGCQVEQFSIRWSNASPRVHSVAATGAAIYSVHDKVANQWSWWVVSGPGGAPREISAPPHTDRTPPILSSDGEHVAWVARIPTEGKSTRPALIVLDLPTNELHEIDLQKFAPASFRLVHFDAQTDEVTVARNEEEFLTVGRDATARWGPWNPEGLKSWAGTLRRLEDGWVAWDAYRDAEPYRLKWSLPAGAGAHELPRGYGIQSAAVDPLGRYVAISIDGRLSFSMPDAVYVLKTSDGSEVFRKSLPQYNRSQVAFLGEEFFAYSDEGGVRVLQLEDAE